MVSRIAQHVQHPQFFSELPFLTYAFWMAICRWGVHMTRWSAAKHWHSAGIYELYTYHSCLHPDFKEHGGDYKLSLYKLNMNNDSRGSGK